MKITSTHENKLMEITNTSHATCTRRRHTSTDHHMELIIQDFLFFILKKEERELHASHLGKSSSPGNPGWISYHKATKEFL